MNTKDETQQSEGSCAIHDHTIDCPETGRDKDSPQPDSNLEKEEAGQPVHPHAPSRAVARIPRPGLTMTPPDPIDTRPVDNFQTLASAARRRKQFITLCVSLSVVGVLGTAVIALLVYNQFRSRTAPGPVEIKSAVSGPIPQPAVIAPKSISDLKVGKFNLEKRGSNLNVAVGDIENTSEYFHRRIRVEVSILGAGGVVLETVSEMITELPPHTVWHVSARTSDPAAVGVAFAGIRED